MVSYNLLFRQHLTKNILSVQHWRKKTLTITMRLLVTVRLLRIFTLREVSNWQAGLGSSMGKESLTDHREKKLNKNNPWKIMEGKITYKGTQLTVISLMAIIWSQIWASGTDWLVIDFLRMGQVHQFMWSHPFCPTSGTRKSNSHLPTTTAHFRKICTPYGLANCSH